MRLTRVQRLRQSSFAQYPGVKGGRQQSGTFDGISKCATPRIWSTFPEEGFTDPASTVEYRRSHWLPSMNGRQFARRANCGFYNGRQPWIWRWHFNNASRRMEKSWQMWRCFNTWVGCWLMTATKASLSAAIYRKQEVAGHGFRGCYGQQTPCLGSAQSSIRRRYRSYYIAEVRHGTSHRRR